MYQLEPWQIEQLVNAPDWDMPLRDGQRLLKSMQQSQRKRSLPNSFATLSGGTVPRSGFLSLEMMRAIYLKSEIVRACVDSLIEFVSAVEWTIKPIDEDHTKWLRDNDPDGYVDQQKRIKWLTELFSRPSTREDYETFQRRILRDLLIYDAAGYEIVFADVDGVEMPIELGAVAGDTIEIETDEQGGVVGYHQSYNVLRNVEYEDGELAYIMLNPCTWQPYGISPIETAYLSIGADLSANKYNLDYFNKNGIPPGLLAVLGVSEPQFRSLVGQLRQTSEDNPHNVHTVRAQRNPDGSAQKVFEYIPLNQQSNRDMQFAELLNLCANRICMSYRVSPSQIGLTEEMTGGIGSGIAETQENLMQNKGVAPLLRRISTIHTFWVVHKGCGWTDLQFVFLQSNTPQEQAEWQRDMQELQSGAMSVNEYRTKYGSRKPVPWGDRPFQLISQWQPPMSPQELQQQMMQQMGGGQPGAGPGPGDTPPDRSPAPDASPPASPAQKPPKLQQNMMKSARRIVIDL